MVGRWGLRVRLELLVLVEVEALGRAGVRELGRALVRELVLVELRGLWVVLVLELGLLEELLVGARELGWRLARSVRGELVLQ